MSDSLMKQTFEQKNKEKSNLHGKSNGIILSIIVVRNSIHYWNHSPAKKTLLLIAHIVQSIKYKNIYSTSSRYYPGMILK